MRICLTGHRPHKLFGYSKKEPLNVGLVEEVIKTIEDIVENEGLAEDEKVILHNGMALGIDLGVAEAFLKRFRNNSKYELHCAIPFKNQSDYFKSLGDKMLWNRIVENADNVHYVSNKAYTKSCLNDRNKYMVDCLSNSDTEEKTFVLSVWDGSNSGTYNCIKYGLLKGHDVFNICPKEYENKHLDNSMSKLIYTKIEK